MYAHEEVINDLDIKENELPNELRTRLKNLKNRIRFAKKEETVNELMGVSEELADELVDWYDSLSEIDDNDFEEEENFVETPKPTIPKVETPKEPISSGQQHNENVVSHSNPIVSEELKEDNNDEDSGWGINLSW